jgi:hypothetical protein
MAKTDHETTEKLNGSEERFCISEFENLRFQNFSMSAFQLFAVWVEHSIVRSAG